MGSKHRRSLSAEKTRADKLENINEDLYNSIKAQNVANELMLNPGKTAKDDEMNIVDDMKFERFKAEEKVQEMLDLKFYQTNPQSTKHLERSKTTLISRPKTTRFIFDEDSGLSKTDLKKSNEKAFEDIKATVTGALEHKDTYDDQKLKKKTFNEVEIWNTGEYNSQKSGKKPYDKYSILNRTIGLSRNDNRDVSPVRYEPKLIKNLVEYLSPDRI